MHRYTLLLSLIFLLGSFQNGGSTDTGRSLSSDVEAEVKQLLGKIAASPWVNPVYKLDDVLLDIQTGKTNLTGKIDGEIKGIPAIKLTKNKFAVIGMKHTVGLTSSKLTASGTYSLGGVVAGVLLINGGGEFLLELDDLSANVVVYVKADTRLPTLLLKNVTVDLTLGKFQVQLDDILGELSDALNRMLNAIAPEVITLYQPQIESLLAGFLFDKIHGLLPGGGGGARGEVDSSQLADGGEVDPAQLCSVGEVDPAQISAVVGEVINHLIRVAIEKMLA